MNEIIYASARTMARAIQDKEVSAVELVEAHLARIEEVNPTINAVVKLAAERARADWRLKRTPRLPEARARVRFMACLSR